MLIYGICVQDNPFETLEIEFDIPAADPLRNEKEALMQKHNIKYTSHKQTNKDI